MTTALICSHDHLIRALYDAKAAPKDAASACKTADHNYKSCCSDPDAKHYHVKPLIDACSAADEHYYQVEKTYDAIHAVCTKLNLI